MNSSQRKSYTMNDTQSSAPKRGRENPYPIQILDENLAVRTIHIADARITGAQLARASGLRQPDDLIILQWLPDGALEEVRPDEVVDVHRAGDARFILAEGDRTYHFILDGLKLSWARPQVLAKVLMALAGRENTFELVQELDVEADRILEEDELAELGDKGTERFKTRPTKPTVTVYFNNDPVEVRKGVHPVEHLMELFHVEPGYPLVFISPDGEFIDLKPGETHKVKAGQKFISHSPCGQSS